MNGKVADVEGEVSDPESPGVPSDNCIAVSSRHDEKCHFVASRPSAVESWTSRISSIATFPLKGRNLTNTP